MNLYEAIALAQKQADETEETMHVVTGPRIGEWVVHPARGSYGLGAKKVFPASHRASNAAVGCSRLAEAWACRK